MNTHSLIAMPFFHQASLIREATFSLDEQVSSFCGPFADYHQQELYRDNIENKHEYSQIANF